MRKKIVAAILSLAMLLPTLSALTVMAQPTDEEIQESIDLGLEWLARQQNPDGSWGVWDITAKTGLALIKLQDRAYELGYESPFDEDYEYSNNVTAGWDYIFNPLSPRASKQAIGKQDHTGGASGALDDPDENGNGIGVFFTGLRTYTTGICLMALEASGTPGRSTGIDFDGDGNPDTFGQVAQDAADWLTFGQGDSGNDEGGWDYQDLNNQTANLWTDNSNSGYAMLGLAAAEGFGCTVPPWVRTELNVWIGTIQDPVNGDADDGGSYYNPDWLPWNPWCNELKAGNLIFQMTFYGDDPTVTRFQDALDYIKRHWNDTNMDPGWRGSWGLDDDTDGSTDEDPRNGLDDDLDGLVDEDTPEANYQAMYCLMKGFEYSLIELIDLDCDGTPEHDWYAEFAQAILDGQHPDGHWYCGWYGNGILDTVWALLTLERVIPPPPVIPVYVDIKPGSWPNPINKGSRGKFAVAICGTEELDVMTIDPGTIRMHVEGVEDGVPPLRWAYEDVATPYTGDPGGGHELGADGYLDLILHFDTQEVVDTLELCVYDDETIPLIVRGSLLEEHGGTAIEGQDHVWLKSPKGKDKGKG